MLLTKCASLLLTLGSCMALRVMTMHTWEGGRHVNDGLAKIAKHIKRVNPDIVALQSILNNSDVLQIVRALGAPWRGIWHCTNMKPKTAILTKHTIITQSYMHTENRSMGVMIELDQKQKVFVWNLHLDGQEYGPGYAFSNRFEIRDILFLERKERGWEVDKIVAHERMGQVINESGRIPILMVGDFNSPSHRDWIESTRHLHRNWVLRWEVTAMLEGAFFMKDSYRELHPDPLADNGHTWSPVFPTSSGSNYKNIEPQDRIDYIFYRGPLMPKRSYTYIGNETLRPAPNHVDNDFPLSHSAVVTDFDFLPPVSTPPKQIPDPYRYTAKYSEEDHTKERCDGNTVHYGNPSLEKSNVPLKMMTFNTWHSGTHVEDGLAKIVKHINLVDPDIVALQEIESKEVMELIIEKLGKTWSGVFHCHRTYIKSAILTKHNIVDGSYAETTTHAVGTLIEFHSFKVFVWSVHLDHQAYSPHIAHWGTIQNVQQIVHGELGGRYPNILELVTHDAMLAAINESNVIPVIVAGDFNAPSHLDWTEETKARHNDLVVQWPTTASLSSHLGMLDSYREVHNNPVLFPGYTWSPVHLKTPDSNYKKEEPKDRIDFIFYRGPLKPLKSYPYNGSEPLKPIPHHRDNDYPSDHAAVVTEFEYAFPFPGPANPVSDIPSEWAEFAAQLKSKEKEHKVCSDNLVQ